ncbi:MAG: hypothetical protein A2Z20_05195 [Bdellovibrionales bacterium RBG_16_40_8]|nr:MAG: hypothetical protein A2Z20_05195 [Bdellovibrionales bacterium RBG_16_40_8]
MPLIVTHPVLAVNNSAYVLRDYAIFKHQHKSFDLAFAKGLIWFAAAIIDPGDHARCRPLARWLIHTPPIG